MFPFQRGDYRTIGAYTAMSIVQGGPGLPIFSGAVLDSFSRGTITGVQIEVDGLPLYLKFLFDQVIISLRTCHCEEYTLFHEMLYYYQA